jgi:hypothetical protein
VNRTKPLESEHTAIFTDCADLRVCDIGFSSGAPHLIARLIMPPLSASLLLLGALHGSAARRLAGDSAGFVTVLGRDTIALESFARSASRLRGEIVLRIPGTVHFIYTFDLNPDGTVARSVVELRPLGAPSLTGRRVTLDFAADSVRETIDSAGATRKAAYAARPGAVPFLTTGFDSSFGIYESFGMYELLFSLPSLHLSDSAAVPIIGAMSGRPGTKRLVRRSATLIDTDFFGIAWTHLTVDETGRITGVDAGATTEKTQAHRTGPIDIARAAKGFAARDRGGKGLGIASPPDSVRTMVGAAHLALDYSSPRRRGRTILGDVVPYGQVWRTGANAATTMYIDRPLTIGNTLVPAGGYSLWTLPTAAGVELIINRETGQWGTDYDPSRDLVRVPMAVSADSSPRENFTILVTDEGGTGELRMQWDTFVWRVTVKAG